MSTDTPLHHATLCTVAIPFTYTYGKGKTSKLLLNDVLAMNWQRRKTHHDLVMDVCKRVMAHTPIHAYAEGMQYRMTVTYYRGHDSKGRMPDIDGFGWLLKVAIDAYKDVRMQVDDNCRYIVETRCVYGGMLDIEQVWFSVEAMHTQPIIVHDPGTPQYCSQVPPKTGKLM